MASIKISELRPAGSELFQDSESFLNELSEREMGSLEGGALTVVGVSLSAQTVVTANGNTINANTLTNVNTVG